MIKKTRLFGFVTNSPIADGAKAYQFHSVSTWFYGNDEPKSYLVNSGTHNAVADPSLPYGSYASGSSAGIRVGGLDLAKGSSYGGAFTDLSGVTSYATKTEAEKVVTQVNIVNDADVSIFNEDGTSKFKRLGGFVHGAIEVDYETDLDVTHHFPVLNGYNDDLITSDSYHYKSGRSSCVANAWIQETITESEEFFKGAQTVFNSAKVLEA